LWANLHGSFPIAAAIGGCLALDALIAARWKTLREWLIFAGTCLVAICLNANGVAGIVQPFHIAGLKSINLVTEWLPSTPWLAPQFYGVLVAALIALLGRGTRIPIGRLILLLAMLGLAFMQVRHQSWLAILAAVLLPALFEGRPQPVRKLVPLAFAAMPLLLIRILWPLTPPESEAHPRGLIAAIPPHLKTQPLFNEYTFGGPLILAGIRPYIDGRNDVYGDAFNEDYADIANGDFARFNRAVDRYGIRWTMLSVRNEALIAKLDSSGHWRRVYADRVGVIHVRSD
jgi:hypothetical protein